MRTYTKERGVQLEFYTGPPMYIPVSQEIHPLPITENEAFLETEAALDEMDFRLLFVQGKWLEHQEKWSKLVPSGLDRDIEYIRGYALVKINKDGP